MAGAFVSSPQEMPGFLPALEIPPRNITREEELEEEVRQSKVETMQVLELLGSEQTQARRPAATGPKPQEWQALQTVISDLLEANVELQATAKRQAKQIEDLEKAKKDLQQDIAEIREYFPKLVAEDRVRLTVLEQGPTTSEPKTVKSHLDGLYDHMKAIGRKQVSFREAAKILEISKQRLHQFKAAIALDTRFMIVDSQSHKQKELIRLRE